MDDHEARRNDDDGVAVDDSSDEGSVRSESSGTGTEDSADVIPSDDDVDDDDDDDEHVQNRYFGADEATISLSSELPHRVDVDVSVIANIRGLTNSEVRQVANDVPTCCDKPVMTLSIDLTGNAHDLRVAKRVTRILRSLDLRELKEFKIKFKEDDEFIHPLKAVIVDHYLAFLLLRVSSVEQLKNVSLPFLGSNEAVWFSFFDRFKYIDHLGIGAHWRGWGTASRINTSGIIRRLRQVPSLPYLSLYLGVQDAQPCISCLFQAVSQLQGLQSLDVDIDYLANDHGDVVAAINGVHGVVALCTSLNFLQIRYMWRWTSQRIETLELDCCQLLESALHSTSITDLRFDNVTLRTSSVGPEDTITNASVKRLVIKKSVIGASGWSLMQRFRGLESIDIECLGLANTYHRTWSEMLMALPRLSSFSESGYFQRHCQERFLAAVVSHVASAPSLGELRLSTAAGVGRQSLDRLLPSLSTLTQLMKGCLTLRHHEDGNDARSSDANLGYVSSGIALSRDLRELDLRFHNSLLTAASVTLLLTVLQRHRSISAFKGAFVVASPWDPHSLDAALFELVATNTSLKSLGLDVTPSDWRDQNRSNKMTLFAILRGLEHNQTLRALDIGALSSPQGVTPLVVAALQSNVTLERINGAYGWMRPIQVKWLLDLNRYKRRVLLTPSAVPKECWLVVVERIVRDHRSDVLYHFLRRILPLLRSCRGVRRPATSQNEE